MMDAGQPETSPAFAVLRRHWRLLALAALTICAFVVRAYDVADNPKGFFTDEASYGLNSWLIMSTGRDEFGGFLPLFFKAFGEYKLPLFIYGEIPFIALLGRTETAVRVASAFFGSLTVIITYLLAKELFRRELPAFSAAAFLAILPWHIHYSRTGFGEVVLLPLVFTAAFYLFFRAMRDARFILPSAIALGLTFYAYRPAWITVPALLAVMAIAYRDEIRANLRVWLPAGAVLAVMLLPIAYHLFFSGSGDRSSQASIFNIESDKSTLQLFSDFYRSYFREGFLFADGDNGPITRHYLPGHGVLYYFQLPLLLIGVVSLAGSLNRRYLFVLAFLLLYPLSASVSDSSPISTRAILGSVSLSLVAAAGLWAIAGTIRARFPRGGHAFALAAIGIVALAAGYSFASYLDRYHSEYPVLSDGYWGWQDGAQEIIEYFVEVEDQYDELYMDGSFNAPAIFFPFYAGDGCKKCTLGGDDRFNPAKRQLFALRPESFHADQYSYRIVHTLYHAGGSVAFVFIEITGRR